MARVVTLILSFLPLASDVTSMLLLLLLLMLPPCGVCCSCRKDPMRKLGDKALWPGGARVWRRVVPRWLFFSFCSGDGVRCGCADATILWYLSSDMEDATVMSYVWAVSYEAVRSQGGGIGTAATPLALSSLSSSWRWRRL